MPPALEAAVSLLDDALAVMPEDRLHSLELAERLAGLRPGLYAGWTATQLAQALSPYGVATRQTFLDGANRQGVRRADLEAARDTREDR